VWGGQRLAHLAEQFQVSAVDISPQQVRRARQAVPRAPVLLGDTTRLDFPSSSFDAVTVFYAFTHLPHGERPSLLVRIGGWLRPGARAPRSTITCRFWHHQWRGAVLDWPV
jgi:SAM-dependent methyltransferase